MFIKSGEYLTINDMAARLNKNREAVKKLLQNAGFKPLDKGALYPIKAFEAIRNAPPPGRPKKPKPEKPEK